MKPGQRDQKGLAGVTVPRESLINRDIIKSPFKDPSSLENPAPTQY